MRHKAASFGRPLRSEVYSKEPYLPPDWIRTKQKQPVKKDYSPTRNSEFRVHQPPRRRSRKRPANYKTLAVLAPTVVLGLLMVRLLFSFLPTSYKAVAPQQFDKLPQKVAVLPSPTGGNSSTTIPVVALGRAIIGTESSGDFESLNSHSGASGFAQIMPANISEWSQDILGYRLTPNEFLNSPELQLTIIYQKLSEYWQKALADSGGDEDLAVLKVASHWYSGNPKLYTSTKPQWYEGTDGQLHRYPSVADYSNSVLKKYRQYLVGET